MTLADARLALDQAITRLAELKIEDNINEVGPALKACSHARDQWMKAAQVSVQSRFSDLIAPDLEHYAQKIAKRALRKAFSDAQKRR